MNPKPSQRRLAAFTLIELLIVVAIIAILAAIAVPNFLEAQVRSKVSRVKAEFRTIRTGVEAYAVDYSKYPRHSWGTYAPGYNLSGGDRYENGRTGPESIYGNMVFIMTTPTAYLSKFDFFDPFVDARKDIEVDWRLYTYMNFAAFDYLRTVPGFGPRAQPPDAITNGGFKRDFGAYALQSIGPKGNISVPWPDSNPDAWPVWAWTQYDPTNGTLSEGLIYCSQASSDFVQRPYP